MTPSHCTTCGREIREGAGRYVTADGTYCTSCGLPFPLGPGVRVTITITGLDRHNKEATHDKQ
ncbi:MAG: hypothetical protein A4E60_01688 [Syntrophorhabdus sp. PtaB.Bin047]|nr:MAG: hypothetical protein A4E60_01688 [Syntrophorhabdus sp. PtaB.Bin047]